MPNVHSKAAKKSKVPMVPLVGFHGGKTSETLAQKYRNPHEQGQDTNRRAENTGKMKECWEKIKNCAQPFAVCPLGDIVLQQHPERYRTTRWPDVHAFMYASSIIPALCEHIVGCF
jgi:hypothetical protein